MEANHHLSRIRGQSKFVVLGALSLLLRQGEIAPSRSRLLQFLRVGRWLTIQPVGNDCWSVNGQTYVQMFSYARKDLTSSGSIAYLPYTDDGVWRISQTGLKKLSGIIAQYAGMGFDPVSLVSIFENECGACIFSEKFAAALFSSHSGISP